jgi:hypothetical protein
MATTVISARGIAFTIDAVDYDPQTTSVLLVNEPTITTYQTLDGKAYKHIDDQWTLNVELLADWGVASSLFESMWNLALNTPNTTVEVTLQTASGASWTADVFPVFPSAGGTAPDAQTDTWTMLVDGVPAITIS